MRTIGGKVAGQPTERERLLALAESWEQSADDWEAMHVRDHAMRRALGYLATSETLRSVADDLRRTLGPQPEGPRWKLWRKNSKE